MNRPNFKDFKIPEWRKYDPGYEDVPLKQYISELEKYIDYVERRNQMGYYTVFDMEVFKADMQPIEESIVEIYQEVQNQFKIAFTSQEKWYSCSDDMKCFSKKYPDYIFIIYGNGEEKDDVWKEYFYNGKSQYTKANIKFEEFNIINKQKEKEHIEELKKTLRRKLAPITPDNYNIFKWEKDLNKPNVIIGKWSEDGAEYEIICPSQIRDCIIAMQNNLKDLLKEN